MGGGRSSDGDPPKRGAKTVSARTADGTGGPPRLETHAWRGIRMLLLINIMPLIGLAYIASMWAAGKLAFDPRLTPRTLVTIGVILGSCALFAFSSWVLAPLGRWLRDYPAWHLRHTGWAWLLPTVLGWLAWLVIWLVCLASAAVCCYVAAVGAWRLYQTFQGPVG